MHVKRARRKLIKQRTQYLIQFAVKHFQVFVVTATSRELDVTVAEFFGGEQVLSAVHWKSKHARVVTENGRVAVAL